MQGFHHQLAPDGHPVNLFELRNRRGMRAHFMDWGATWLSCKVLVGSKERETLLRSPNLAAHLEQQAYLGATVGRYANRIGDARYPHLGNAGSTWVQLDPNDGANSLHGGPQGFGARRWGVQSYSPSSICFELLSPDGDQGFPGNLRVQARYALNDDNVLLASFDATTDKVCPVGLTSHAYFNLAASHGNILEHKLRLAADHYLPVHASGIPYQEPASVEGTSFDFRAGKTLAQDFLACGQQRDLGGYDHGFLLDTCAAESGAAAATLEAPEADLQLEVRTTKPALQLYTGNHLKGTPGASGQPYAAQAGVALESAFLPDSPNHPEWPQPSCILQPGQAYRHQTWYRFQSLLPGVGSDP